MMAGLTRTRLRAIAFTAFIALVWLNQSIGGKDWEAFRDRTLAAPGEHMLDALRYPFVFLYRRSGDEAIYFATASATLGLPYDTEVFAQRGDSPLPPVTTPTDGRFHVPYAEVPFEYPPVNVAFVVGPRLLVTSFASYGYLFGALMGALLVIAAVLGAGVGAGAGDDAPAHREKDQAERVVAFGLLLLAHGAIAIQRLDAIVALMAILMVRAAVRRKDAELGLWGGLIGATKIVPVMLLPALVLASGTRETRRLAAMAIGAAIGLVVGLGPMLVLGRASLPLLLTYHSARGLHVESTLGVVYGATKAALGMREGGRMDYGSFNFHGPVSQALARASTALTVGLAGLVLHAAWRSGSGSDAAARARTEGEERAELEAREASDGTGARARTERIVLAALAMTTALWLGGKVFSPQYLTWALPLVIAVPGRAWRRVALAFGVILVLSQVYLRGFYDHVYNQWPAGVLTMVVRLVVLVAFLVFVVRRLKALRAPASP